jgi:hypothetical protein
MGSATQVMLASMHQFRNDLNKKAFCAGGSCDSITCVVLPQGDREGNREGPSVLVQGGDAKHLGPISGLARPHDASISFPVPSPQALRNDQIERMAERVLRREPKNPLRCRVP